MTLLSYEIFQTIVEQESFAKAAELMHLTPSAISHAVSSMEKELGFPLFTRSKSGVALTSAGEQIAPYIRKIVSSSNSLMQEVDSMKGLESGVVKLGCTNTICTTWLPEISKRFSQDHPGIQLEIYQASHSRVLSWAHEGIIDICLITEESNDSLIFTPLYRDNLVCVTPKGYMPKYTQFITPADLKNRPFVIQEEHHDNDINKFLNTNKLHVRANCHVQDDESSLTMVSCGIGVTIMSEMYMSKVAHDVAVDTYPIQPSPYRTIGIGYVNRHTLSPAAREMMRYISEYAAEIN